MPETLLRKWFAQLVQALNYVHSKGLVHKDVKVRYFSENPMMKIFFSPPAKSLTRSLTTF